MSTSFRSQLIAPIVDPIIKYSVAHKIPIFLIIALLGWIGIYFVHIRPAKKRKKFTWQTKYYICAWTFMTIIAIFMQILVYIRGGM